MGAVGIRTPRLDAIGKVTGQADFCEDVVLKGALQGAVLRSPYAHARIVSIDTSKAASLPGVVAVVTAADTPRKRFGTCIHDEYVLAADKVRFVGDEVAAVAARDQDTVRKALDLIEVIYEPLPSLFSTEAALQAGAPVIQDDFPDNIAEKYVIERGDLETGFAASTCIVENTFNLQHVNTCYLEPTTCLSLLEENNKLTVWAPAAGPFRVRDTISLLFDLPASRIRVLKPVVGGAFGARHVPKYSLIAALLTLKTKQPVVLTASRDEEFLMGRPRVAATIKLRLGFAQDGTLMAKQTEIIADNGGYTDRSPLLVETMSQRIDSLYRIKNIRTNTRIVYTNNIPTGAYRGFGNPQMHFAMESLMDMAALKLGLDPIALRRKNATQVGDVTAHGWLISSCALTECLDKVRQESGWEEKRRAYPEEGHDPGSSKKRGIGAACMIHVAGRRSSPGYWGSTAWVKVHGSGKVEVISGESDTGQGCNTVFAIIAAEELGVSMDVMEVAFLDTDKTPYSMGSFSDRVTVLGGSAVRLAAADAKRQLIQLGARYFAVPDSQVSYENGKLRVNNGTSEAKEVDMFAMIRQLEARQGEAPVHGSAIYQPETVVFRDETRFGNNNISYTFAAQVAEVEVDTKTGEVKILNFTSAHDCGRAINPMAAEGQVEGALSQGFGYALTEKVVLEEGQMLNPSFLEYKMPTAADMFKPNVFLIESMEPNGPFGAKGVGEPGLVPTAPAIANAIYNAIGFRATSLPITPEVILENLEAKGRD